VPPAGGLPVANRVRRFLAGDAGPGPSLALAVIALLAAFLAAAGPREITSLQNKALRQTLAQAGGFSVSASSSWQIIGVGQAVTADQIQTMSGVMASYLRAPLVSPSRQQWAGLTAPLLGVLNPAPQAVAFKPPQLEVAYRGALSGNARLVSGTMPRSATPHPPPTSPFPLHWPPSFRRPRRHPAGRSHRADGKAVRAAARVAGRSWPGQHHASERPADRAEGHRCDQGDRSVVDILDHRSAGCRALPGKPDNLAGLAGRSAHRAE
jgi:hypothetical protein